MRNIKIKKGLNIPIMGEPVQVVSEQKSTSKVALIGYDYPGMKPTLKVHVGDIVKKGQLLFTDKKMEGVNFTSPGSGKIMSINRGLKRVFESIVIRLEGNDEVKFKSYSGDKTSSFGRENVRSLLLESGQWTALKERPFGKVADPSVIPHSIFITAMDTNPLAPSMEKVIVGHEEDFIDGLNLIAKLTEGKIFLCRSKGSMIPAADSPNVEVVEFSGPHPSGLPGTHIHFLDPVGSAKKVWYLGLQDVIAAGILFKTGSLYTERIVSLGGPSIIKPRLIKTRVGADISELVSGEIRAGDNRILSGSILNGRSCAGYLGFLGRYHQQITVLREGKERKFFGWMAPGFNKFSARRILGSALFPNKKFDFTTSLEGGSRPIIPVESYNKVMPLDLIPAYLLRALAVTDIEESEKLGCLELVEEDLALCTFVCASKNDYGTLLRRNLTIIEKEG